MESMELYNPDYNIGEIFKALEKVKKDEMLPEGELFEYFLNNSHYPGVTLFLRHKNKTKFFYVDHDEFFMEIKGQKPDWDIVVDGKLVRISLVYKIRDRELPVAFQFDLAKREYRELLEVIRKDKTIELYYLIILYGGLVLDSVNKFKIPSHILDVLKKFKQK